MFIHYLNILSLILFKYIWISFFPLKLVQNFVEKLSEKAVIKILKNLCYLVSRSQGVFFFHSSFSIITRNFVWISTIFMLYHDGKIRSNIYLIWMQFDVYGSLKYLDKWNFYLDPSHNFKSIPTISNSMCIRFLFLQFRFNFFLCVYF